MEEPKGTAKRRVKTAAAAQEDKITLLPLSELHDFPNHPFKVRDDEAIKADFPHKRKRRECIIQNCTPAETLSFPTVSTFLLVLLLPCLLLLFPAQKFPDRPRFRFLVQ